LRGSANSVLALNDRFQGGRTAGTGRTRSLDTAPSETDLVATSNGHSSLAASISSAYVAKKRAVNQRHSLQQVKKARNSSGRWASVRKTFGMNPTFSCTSSIRARMSSGKSSSLGVAANWMRRHADKSSSEERADPGRGYPRRLSSRDVARQVSTTAFDIGGSVFAYGRFSSINLMQKPSATRMRELANSCRTTYKRSFWLGHGPRTPLRNAWISHRQTFCLSNKRLHGWRRKQSRS
jgi:hypothetical protein